MAPWRSVYKLHVFTDTELTFVLASGGHNVGVVNPPNHGFEGALFQIATRPRHARYIDPDTWAASVEHHAGSWWPAWQAWLALHSGKPATPPRLGNPDAGIAPLADAPGSYVFGK